MNTQPYDVVIIGAGASGTALLYTLATYTNISRIALVEKYSMPGQVNSKATNNSQTLHVGDIETNYTIDKVRHVYPAAMMVAQYAKGLSEVDRSKILFPTTKMVLGVGKEQVVLLEKRYEELLPLFPSLQKLYGNGIAQVEPAVMAGRDPKEPIIALYTTEGYAVDFERLSQSFVIEAQKQRAHIDALFNSTVTGIKKIDDGSYAISMQGKEAINAKVVVVDADSYSLFFAKQMGYGSQYSLIPIAGNFYFTPKLLNGKVYTVQEPKLPFAAVHGDPDVRVPDQTRWGPTARFHPVLESRNMKTARDYIKSSGLNKWRTWKSFGKILLDPVRLTYLLKNMLYELPWVGDQLFLSNIKKIVPTIQRRDVTVAKGYGGMRLQRVDTTTAQLQLGEGKIVGDNIIFNMTPSPGASVALYNGLRDAVQIVSFLGQGYRFDQTRMEEALVVTHHLKETPEPSIPVGYAS
jgi:malate dehydrogenase (quinone)